MNNMVFFLYIYAYDKTHFINQTRQEINKNNKIEPLRYTVKELHECGLPLSNYLIVMDIGIIHLLGGWWGVDQDFITLFKMAHN